MSKKNNHIIETRISKMYWEDEQNGIVISESKPKVEITVADLKEDYEVLLHHFLHPKRKLIVDVTDLHRIGKEAKDYMAGEKGVYNYCEAIAFLSSSKFNIGSILAQVGMKVYTLRKPTEIFYDKQKAIDWLKSIK